MTEFKKLATGALAAVAVLGGNVAAAQQQCVTEKEFAHTMIYATPLAIDAAKAKCASSLQSSGYLLSSSDNLRAKYAALQNETWPSAKSAAFKMAQSTDAASQLNTFAAFPDEALRPFVDALVTQKLNENIKAKDCKNIERGMRLLAPFSPRDAGALLGFVAGLTDSKTLPVCKED